MDKGSIDSKSSEIVFLDMTGTFSPKLCLPKQDPEKNNSKILFNMGEGNSWGLLQR